MFRRNIFATFAAAVVASASAAAAVAWDDRQTDDDSSATGSPSTGRTLSAGRIVRVDMATGTITIEHRPIAHLYMETMTMKFLVRDPAMLTALTPGAKIRFEVERDGGEYVIKKIENSN